MESLDTNRQVGFTVLPCRAPVPVYEVVAGFQSDCQAILGHLPDYSREAEALASHRDTVWQSADRESFRQDGKINFLRVQPDGFVLLDVFKPGCHFTTQVFIGAESARETKQFLATSPLDWQTKSASWKGRKGQPSEQ